jgi:hypothetical protein
MMVSCDSDDNQNTPTISDDPGLSVIIDGSTYSNHSYKDALYQISKPNPSTFQIDASDENGDQITIFLNGTNGFSDGAVKEMGNTDENNFTTYLLVRQASTQLNYFATTTGQVVISSHRPHPSKEGFSLISGSISVSASTTDAANAVSVVGLFTDLEYQP